MAQETRATDGFRLSDFVPSFLNPFDSGRADTETPAAGPEADGAAAQSTPDAFSSGPQTRLETGTPSAGDANRPRQLGLLLQELRGLERNLDGFARSLERPVFGFEADGDEREAMRTIRSRASEIGRRIEGMVSGGASPEEIARTLQSLEILKRDTELLRRVSMLELPRRLHAGDRRLEEGPHPPLALLLRAEALDAIRSGSDAARTKVGERLTRYERATEEMHRFRERQAALASFTSPVESEGLIPWEGQHRETEMTAWRRTVVPDGKGPDGRDRTIVRNDAFLPPQESMQPGSHLNEQPLHEAYRGLDEGSQGRWDHLFAGLNRTREAGDDAYLYAVKNRSPGDASFGDPLDRMEAEVEERRRLLPIMEEAIAVSQQVVDSKPKPAPAHAVDRTPAGDPVATLDRDIAQMQEVFQGEAKLLDRMRAIFSGRESAFLQALHDRHLLSKALAGPMEEFSRAQWQLSQAKAYQDSGDHAEAQRALGQAYARYLMVYHSPAHRSLLQQLSRDEAFVSEFRHYTALAATLVSMGLASLAQAGVTTALAASTRLAPYAMTAGTLANTATFAVSHAHLGKAFANTPMPEGVKGWSWELVKTHAMLRSLHHVMGGAGKAAEALGLGKAMTTLFKFETEATYFAGAWSPAEHFAESGILHGLWNFHEALGSTYSFEAWRDQILNLLALKAGGRLVEPVTAPAMRRAQAAVQAAAQKAARGAIPVVDLSALPPEEAARRLAIETDERPGEGIPTEEIPLDEARTGGVSHFGGVDFRVADGELVARSSDPSNPLVINGQEQVAGQWAALEEGDTVKIGDRFYTRGQGRLHAIQVADERSLVVARGENGVIVDNGNGTLTKIGGSVERDRQLDSEQRALAHLQASGLDFVPPLIGRPHRSELVIGQLPGRKVSQLSIPERQAIPETAWRRLGQDIQAMRGHGIHHNDVSAANILWDGNRLYLIDFGMAEVGVRSNDDLSRLAAVRRAVAEGREGQSLYPLGLTADIDSAQRVGIPEIPFEASIPAERPSGTGRPRAPHRVTHRDAEGGIHRAAAHDGSSRKSARSGVARREGARPGAAHHPVDRSRTGGGGAVPAPTLHMIEGKDVSNTLRDVPPGEKVLVIDFASVGIPEERTGDVIIADHHSNETPGTTATERALQLRRQGALEGVTRIIANHSDADSVLAEAIARGTIPEGPLAERALAVAKAGDYLVGDMEAMKANWILLGMIYGARGGRFQKMPREEIVKLLPDILEHPEKYEMYYQGMAGFVEASQRAVAAGSTEVRGRVALFATATYAHPLAAYWAAEPTSAEVVIKQTPHEKGGFQYDIGFVPSKGIPPRYNLDRAFRRLRELEIEKQRERGNGGFNETDNWGCDPCRAGGSPKTQGSVLTLEEVYRVITSEVEGLAAPLPPPGGSGGGGGATSATARYPQFKARVASILERCPAERQTEAAAAIEASFSKVPEGADASVVGKTVGPELARIEKQYATLPRANRREAARQEGVEKARVSLRDRHLLEPWMEAEIQTYVEQGGEPARQRVEAALLSAGGHVGEGADIRAYNALRGFLLEARRTTAVGRALEVTQGDVAQTRKVRISYLGVKRSEQGWQMEERTSDIELDVPTLGDHIYETKFNPRLDWGLETDGSVSEGALNQLIKYNAAVKAGLFRGATVEVSGCVSPEFFQLAARFAPEVEILYNLKLPSGAEISFRIKTAPDGRPTLRRVPNIHLLPVEDQRAIDGVRRLLNSGRIFRDNVFESRFLKVSDIPDGNLYLKALQAASQEDGSIDPYKITDIDTYLEWEKLLHEKRLRYFDAMSERVPLRRATDHLREEITDDRIERWFTEINHFLENAPEHTRKQYLVRDPQKLALVRAEFVRRLRLIAEFERGRLAEDNPEELARGEARAAMGYTGPREGYPLDPIHIYMDVVKGLREAERRGSGPVRTGGTPAGEETAREARSYEREWPSAEAVLADLMAGKYAGTRRYVRIVYPETVEPDVGEQLTNSREIEVRDDAELATLQRKSHEQNRTRLKQLREKLGKLGQPEFEAALEPTELRELRSLAQLFQQHHREIDALGHRLDGLVQERDREFAESDRAIRTNTEIPDREKGRRIGAARGEIARKYEGRIRDVERETFQMYERILGTHRYHRHFEYVAGIYDSDVVKFIYVVGADGVARLVHEDLRPGSERPAHSELARGRNVYGAGQIWVKGTPVVGPDGRRRVKVQVVDDGSGHYRPDTMSMLPYVKAVLERSGFSVDEAEFRHAPLPVVPLSDRFDAPIEPWFHEGNGNGGAFHAAEPEIVGSVGVPQLTAQETPTGQIAASSDVSRDKYVNQDRAVIGVSQAGDVHLVVADGLGSYKGAEKIAQAIGEEVVQGIRRGEGLAEIFAAANRRVRELKWQSMAAREGRFVARSGAVVTGVTIRNIAGRGEPPTYRAFYRWMGDAPARQARRGADGHLYWVYRTRAERLSNTPFTSSPVTNALSGETEISIRETPEGEVPDPSRQGEWRPATEHRDGVPLEEGDVVIVSSDGLDASIPIPEHLLALIEDCKTSEEANERLQQEALYRQQVTRDVLVGEPPDPVTRRFRFVYQGLYQLYHGKTLEIDIKGFVYDPADPGKPIDCFRTDDLSVAVYIHHLPANGGGASPSRTPRGGTRRHTPAAAPRAGHHAAETRRSRTMTPARPEGSKPGAAHHPVDRPRIYRSPDGSGGGNGLVPKASANAMSLRSRTAERIREAIRARPMHRRFSPFAAIQEVFELVVDLDTGSIVERGGATRSAAKIGYVVDPVQNRVLFTPETESGLRGAIAHEGDPNRRAVLEAILDNANVKLVSEAPGPDHVLARGGAEVIGDMRAISDQNAAFLRRPAMEIGRMTICGSFKADGRLDFHALDYRVGIIYLDPSGRIQGFLHRLPIDNSPRGTLYLDGVKTGASVGVILNGGAVVWTADTGSLNPAQQLAVSSLMERGRTVRTSLPAGDIDRIVQREQDHIAAMQRAESAAPTPSPRALPGAVRDSGETPASHRVTPARPDGRKPGASRRPSDSVSASRPVAAPRIVDVFLPGPANGAGADGAAQFRGLLKHEGGQWRFQPHEEGMHIHFFTGTPGMSRIHPLEPGKFVTIVPGMILTIGGRRWQFTGRPERPFI